MNERVEDMTDLAPEQQVMAALLSRNGLSTGDALAIVRANRMDAYRLGAHVLPPLQAIAGAIAGAIAALLELFAETEGADK